MSSVANEINDQYADRRPAFSDSPLRVVLHASNIDGGGKDSMLITDLGLEESFIHASGARVLEVFVHTGKPKLDPNGPGPVVRVNLEHPIVSYNMLVGDNGNFRMVTIGCTERTHYVVMRGNISFAFYVPRSSMTMQDAVLELLFTNLLKGPRIYVKTAIIIHKFFEKIMACVFPDPVILTTTIRSIEQHEMPCRIYFDPDDIEGTMISIDGYVYGYDLNTYPKSQINKTLRVIAKGEKRDRRSVHRSAAHMNFREKQELAARLEARLAGTTVSTDEKAGTIIAEPTAQALKS